LDDETRTSRFSTKKITINRKRETISHAANILGRTFEEVLNIYDDAFGSEAAAQTTSYTLFIGWEN
jgi:hypothetical protein